MKRSLCISLLCLLYFLSSAGVNLNLHYCGGRIKALSLFHSDEKDCCGKEMKKPGCCKEKTISYKVQSDQDLCSKVLYAKTLTADVIHPVITETSLLEKILISHASCPTDDPPDRSLNPRFLVNRSFRI